MRTTHLGGRMGGIPARFAAPTLTTSPTGWPQKARDDKERQKVRGLPKSPESSHTEVTRNREI